MSTVYITKQPHGKYLYLANWQVNGVSYYDWFSTLKDLHEYFDRWCLKYVQVNF